MGTVTLTLPEARAELSGAARRVNALSSVISDRVLRADFPTDTDGTYLSATRLLQSIDQVLAVIQTVENPAVEEWADLIVMAKALRSATYLILVNARPDQAGYWTAEHQAHIRAADRELTPERRQRILADIHTAYAALDPRDQAALEKEDRLYEGALADGFDGHRSSYS
jgi:hypothetical protein